MPVGVVYRHLVKQVPVRITEFDIRGSCVSADFPGGGYRYGVHPLFYVGKSGSVGAFQGFPGCKYIRESDVAVGRDVTHTGDYIFHACYRGRINGGIGDGDHTGDLHLHRRAAVAYHRYLILVLDFITPENVVCLVP